VLGRETKRVGEKLCACVVGIQLGTRRAKTVEEGQERKERLRFAVCPERAGLVP
jgi:hypothetical protein